MSEKRFLTVKSIDNLYSLVDKEKEGKDQIILMSLHKEDLDNIRDLLNHFVDENEQLRQILKDIVVATDETYTKNTSIFKVTVVLDYEKYREIRRSIE